MSDLRKPRKLHDVSHLFLSRGRESAPTGSTAEALLWLISLGGEGNRAFMASGCAAAAAAKGIHVTLLEIAGGLPNIGYYFGLAPSEYAAVGVDPKRLVMGDNGPNLQFVLGARTESFGLSSPRFSKQRLPHLLLLAFDGGCEYSVIEGIGGKWLPGHGGRPDAVCLFGGPEAREEFGTVLTGVRERHADAYILDLSMGGSAAGAIGADENFSIPDRLASSWRKKSPPEDPFFDDVVSTVLQVLSHRRRGTEDHAAG